MHEINGDSQSISFLVQLRRIVTIIEEVFVQRNLNADETIAFVINDGNVVFEIELVYGGCEI